MSTIEDELGQLEKDLRQLQIEYDTYFSGGRPRPPTDTEFRVQRSLKRFAEMGGRLRYADRFRYNNLASRYAKYSEIWRQRSRRVEAGYSPYGYSKVARELEKQRLAEAERRHQARARVHPACVSLRDPLKEREKLQLLYHAMVEAKSQAREAGDINFEQFSKFVRRKTQQLQKQMNCQTVQYEVSVQNGRVKLKAKCA